MRAAWTTHIPAGYLQELETEYADTPNIIRCLEEEDGLGELSSAIYGSKPQLEFFFGESVGAFLDEIDRRGVESVIVELRSYQRRDDLESLWDNEIYYIVLDALEATDE